MRLDYNNHDEAVSDWTSTSGCADRRNRYFSAHKDGPLIGKVITDGGLECASHIAKDTWRRVKVMSVTMETGDKFPSSETQ